MSKESIKDDTSERRSKLSPVKQALLEKRLRGEFKGDPKSQAIPRRAARNLVPLSFAQQRLWFLDELQPDSPLYNVPSALRVSGRLDVAALHRTLEALVARHESLRTSFATIEGEPVQVINQNLPLSLPVISLSQLPESERETEALQLATKEAFRSFDLSRGPLVRTTLLRLSDEEHILLLTLHHIISDGWSMGVLFRELGALYEAFSQGRPWPLADLPIQYADYAVWQRQWLQGEELEKQISFWKRQLDGSLPVLELPTDHPRPPVQSFRGTYLDLALPKKLSEDILRLSQREGATLFMTLLAAFQTLLARYTGRDDIIVGSPIANRTRIETEGLIGFFLNTLVMRTDLSGDPTFRELLGRVKEVALGAYAHQDLPFEKLVEELQPERNLSHNPLFQVSFTLQNERGSKLDLAGLTSSPFQAKRVTSKFDLAFFVLEEAGQLQVKIEYSTDLFKAATVARMLGHFLVLLEGIIADPDQRLSELPLLTGAERHQLLAEWNDTTTDYLKDRCVHQLFEAQVEQTPGATAVIFELEQLTYRELNQRSNQVAHYLRLRGVGPEVRVGILMERSLEMVVGLLGILKAGGAYVPLDPAYPQERLQYMLADAEVPVLLTQARLVEGLPPHDGEVVCLDADWEEIARQRTENVKSGVKPENLAYVIYTSGSTGRPKGIGLPHTSLVNLLVWHHTALLPAARTLQFASLSFDASFHEMFAAWCSGGSLFIVADALRPDVVGLTRYLQEMRIEKVILPVVVLQQIAEAFSDQPQVFTSLREVTTTGEQLHITQPIVKLFKNLENCSLHNHYGPSESHVVTALTLTGSPDGWPTHPPIGRPIANTQIYILDRQMNPVPIGVPGELHIGGVSLARGYLKRPELTAEKFIPDPFSTEVGARLYKTGDQARYLPDGDIEYLGRIDLQVKIRGFRIELGEVEGILSQHAGVHETVVMAREDAPGDKRLVAYLVMEPEAAPSISELRNYMKEKLPEYMVPQAFVMLEQMPLTPNGKVDRQALPASDETRPELEQTYVAARNPVEEVVAGTWAEVLRLEQVGIYDNFFELGGHSLLATQVISRIRTAFEVEVPLRLLFEEPTVAGLSTAILQGSGEREKVEKTAQLLMNLSQLSEEEVETLLDEKALLLKGD